MDSPTPPMTIAEKTGRSEGAQSIARAALLLRTLSTFGSTGASLLQIGRLTQLPKATVHRILAALLAERLVERPDGTRNYRLGPEVYAFGVSMLDVFDLKSMAQPSLQRLAKETGETIYLGVRCGYDAVCLDKVQGALESSALILNVHDRWPMGIGSFSLAIMAFLPDQEIRDIIAFNQLRDADAATFEHIWRSIEKTRKHGYAVRKTRAAHGIAGVAVPVFDRRRYPIASLCAVSSSDRMHGGYLEALATGLQRESELIGAHYKAERLNTNQGVRWRLSSGGPAPNRLPA